MAQRRIASLLEQQKDWTQAIELIKRSSSDDKTKHQLAHYHCELAKEELNRSDLHSAKAHLKNAFAYDKNFVRAQILQARIAIQENKSKEAVNLLYKIMQQDTNFVSQLLPDFYRLAEKQNDLEVFDTNLQRIVDQHPDSLGSIVSALVVSNLTKTEGSQNLIRNYVKESKAFSKLRDSLSAQNNDTYTFESILAMLTLAGHGKAAYQCNQCGYTSSLHQWNCPGCRQWGTAKASSLYQ